MSLAAQNNTTYFPYNVTWDNFYNIRNARSIYFNLLLNPESLQNIEGKVGRTAFEKIRNYQRSNQEDRINETVLRVGNAYLFGYYHRWDKKYVLMQFENDPTID